MYLKYYLAFTDSYYLKISSTKEILCHRHYSITPDLQAQSLKLDRWILIKKQFRY